MKCRSCLKENAVIVKRDFDSKESDFKNNPIIIKNAAIHECPDCGETWILSDELKRINLEIEKQKYEILSPEQITLIRESLPLKTKREVSEFLCLNEKAFVKWEKGYNELNRANDLLLRLVARSKDNFDFVKELHDKKFRFEHSDYYFLKKINVSSSAPKAVPVELDINKLVHSALEAIKTKNESKQETKDYPGIGEAA